MEHPFEQNSYEALSFGLLCAPTHTYLTLVCELIPIYSSVVRVAELVLLKIRNNLGSAFFGKVRREKSKRVSSMRPLGLSSIHFHKEEGVNK